MFGRLKDFDLYRRTPKDLTESSFLSSILSVGACIFMLLLFIMELWGYLSAPISTNIIIDPNTDSLLRINFNISVLNIPCEYATIDVVDVLGTRRDNVTRNINKWQLNKQGMKEKYAGRNVEQPDLLHDTHFDLASLHLNGIHAIPINEENFDSWLLGHEYTFVNFYAPWCVWCQSLHPVWEALAEEVERKQLPVSVVQVDCVNNKKLCLKEKIQAFPLLKLYKKEKLLYPDYRNDRTVDSFMNYLTNKLKEDNIKVDDRKLLEADHENEQKEEHPGCMLSGHLLVNRVPGNFHIEMRSKHHNINPTVANLNHIVHSLTFGPVLYKSHYNKLSSIPKEYLDLKNLDPMEGKVYESDKLHQAFHHHIKVVSTLVEPTSRYSKDNAIPVMQMVQSSQVMNYDESEIPEARFSYDLSPMAVIISRKGKPFYEFITSMCALIGGTFTVVGLLSGIINTVFKAKKV